MMTPTPIIDIRCNDLRDSLATEIYNGLNVQPGTERTLPTVLLYNTKGLRIFEQITYVDEYYLTNTEIEVLTKYAQTMARILPANAQILELGSGNLCKIDILLREFDRIEKSILYYALDLSIEELQRTFANITAYKHVDCLGLHGTYDDALAWLQNPANRTKPTCILSLGSSIGNFTRDGAAQFLGQFASILGPEDSMMIGLDGRKDADKVYRAYNDSQGITRQFYENGLLVANEVLDSTEFKLDEWEVVGEYDIPGGRHWAYYSPRKDLSVLDILLKKGEKIRFEEAYKYSRLESAELWLRAGLFQRAVFGDSTDEYHIHLLGSTARSGFDLPSKYAKAPMPTIEDWEGLWIRWDSITKEMIPTKELSSKPIELRNPLIFYLGHIPTFLDIHLARATGGAFTEPKHYASIFERGIDPDVDNPDKCHDHSEIPDEWPPVSEINQYQQQLRDRIRSLMLSDQTETNPTLAEALWIGFEHEAMHLETFLYMLLQSDKILPLPGASMPDFKDKSQRAAAQAVPNQWFNIPARTLSIGLDKPETGHLPGDSFEWDNEKPRRTIQVAAFEAQGRPITNGEYARFLEQTDCRETHVMDYAVRTVYGLVMLQYAADWPAIASYDELAQYAAWMNCRLPTFEEVQSIYQYAEQLEQSSPETNGETNDTNGVDSQKSHVEETIETVPNSLCVDHQPVKKGLSMRPVYINLDGCNVGFKHWHPTPVTSNGDRLCGQGAMGGVWEWTVTPLRAHEGFKAMDIYPGYTADFFDGKHNIVLGGSWATHPRLAGRTTFINWYQRNYPFTWAGARLVRDI